MLRVMDGLTPSSPSVLCICARMMEMSLAYLEDYIISCPRGRSAERASELASEVYYPSIAAAAVNIITASDRHKKGSDRKKEAKLMHLITCTYNALNKIQEIATIFGYTSLPTATVSKVFPALGGDSCLTVD